MTRQTKPAGPSRWVLLVRTLFVIASIVALYFLAAINLEWRQQAIFGAILLCFAIVMNRVSNAQQVTLLICVLSMFSTVRYAHYRFSSTYTYLSFNWTQARLVDLVFVFILLSAETTSRLIAAGVDTAYRGREKPSDHAPTWVHLSDASNER